MERRVRRAPVVDSAGLVGVVEVSDLAKQLEFLGAVFNTVARVSAPRGMYA